LLILVINKKINKFCKLKQKGFTLIELLVVIAIIGTLAAVVAVSVNSARAKARDVRRRADLRQIVTALNLYYDKNNTYVVSGYGANGGGQRWFGYEDGSYYTRSVARGLMDAGFLGSAFIDDPVRSKRPGYMIYICNSGHSFSISATLENPTADDIDHIQTVCNGVGSNGVYTRYGKNIAMP
jgi:prepilin-type N-terminal cleavage/methylation domain-containing protein